MTPHAREALRQQMLLRALLGDARPAVVAGWLRGDGPRVDRGLAAYRANAAALAERALAAAYPTLQQLIGEPDFAALARDFWRRQPPASGDIGLWGGALPAFVAEAESLADEPCLADVARLEWAVHEAASAADAGPPQGLQRLAEEDAATLWLQWVPGTVLVASPHPVASIWLAHRSDAADRFAPVREAYARGGGETALVVREGWRVSVQALGVAEAAFTGALLAEAPLAQALQMAGPAFDFEAWLIEALRRQRLAAVQGRPADSASGHGPAEAE